MTWIHENFGDRAEGKVTKGDKIAFVRRWFPVCFDTKENMTDCLKQLDELIAAALSENAESQNIIIDQYAKRLSEAEIENRKLKEELEKLGKRLKIRMCEHGYAGKCESHGPKCSRGSSIQRSRT